MGHFQYISVDCGHTNLNIAIEVNTDIYHDVYYNCAEFEGNRQSLRGPLSAETTYNLTESSLFHTVSHVASLIRRFITRNLKLASF